MPFASRSGDLTLCPLMTPAPHISGKLKERHPVCLEINGKSIVRLADHAVCQAPPDDVVITGAATVTVCGLPIARLLDKMIHGGIIIQGSSNVFVGGPSFAMPSNMSFSNGTPEQISVAMRDMYFLSTTRSGREMFRRIETTQQPIRIRFFSEPNGQSTPDDTAADTTAGVVTGSTIDWNPDAHFTAVDVNGDDLATPPQVALFHEMTHSLALAEGTDEFYMGTHEDQAIGINAHADDFPTENSLRDDLNLPRRADHSGEIATSPGLELRPGDC